jgi:uncharacterized cupin superfamily protein
MTANKATLVAMDIAPRRATIYPKEFASAVEGRAKRALGDAFGLSQFGVNLTTLEPGAASSHRHWHQVEDEFIHVVEGTITLVDNAGKHKLTPGMCAGFKAGVANGHQLLNETDRPVSYLEIGTRSDVEQVDYPDVDMRGTKTGGKFTVTRKDGSVF